MMKPISTEDTGVLLEYDKRVGILIFSILLAVSVASSFYITPFSIGDTDPSTYVAVPLLMLPLFSLFMLKEEIKPNTTKRDIMLGISTFALLAVITVFLRYQLSYLFLSYRIDMLLFPMLIISFAFLLFGSSNIHKFKYIAVYSMLASSLIAAPIIMANFAFTEFNTHIIYLILRIFIPGISLISPLTVATNGYQISIGETCVGIGILISIILFLMPLAYLYNGERKKKFLWLLSAIIILFLLNIGRMFSIALFWLLYGPTSALMEVHVFAGVLLFYISIILMVLLSGRYGLELKTESQKNRTQNKAGRASKTKRAATYSAYGIIISILMAIAYFAMTYNYSSALYISQIHLYTPSYPKLTSEGAYAIAGSILNRSETLKSISLSGNFSEILSVYGQNINYSEPLIVYMGYYKNTGLPIPVLGRTGISSMHFTNQKGISGSIYYLESNMSGFLVYHAIIPDIGLNGSSAIPISTYLILPASELETSGACTNGFSYTDYLINIANPTLYNTTLRQQLNSGYCLFKKVLS